MKVITNMLQKIHSSQIIHGNTGSNVTLESKLNSIDNLLISKKYVTLYDSTSSGGILNTNVNITLNESMAGYDFLIVVIGVGGADTASVLLPVNYPATVFNCTALSNYRAYGHITTSNYTTNLRFNVREVVGWTADGIKIFKVYGINL